MTNATLTASIKELSVVGVSSSALKVHNLTTLQYALQSRQSGPVVGVSNFVGHTVVYQHVASNLYGVAPHL